MITRLFKYRRVILFVKASWGSAPFFLPFRFKFFYMKKYLLAVAFIFTSTIIFAQQKPAYV